MLTQLKKNSRQIRMTIELLNSHHLKALRKKSHINEIALDNIYSKIILPLRISLIEIEFSKLMYGLLIHTKKFFNDDIQKSSTIQQRKKLLDFCFHKHYLPNNNRELNIHNLGHTAYYRYSTLKGLLEVDLNNFIEMRNKLAHGQRAIAFNYEGTSTNQELTTYIWTLTKKEMMLVKSLYKNIPNIFKYLISSKTTFENVFDKYVNRILQAKKDADLKYEFVKNKKSQP